jgi:hypothetical protein
MATKTQPKRPTKKRRNATPKLDETPLRNLERITARLANVRRQEQALRDEQIDAIFDARNAGFSLRKIADSAGVSNPRIHATLRDYAEA